MVGAEQSGAGELRPLRGDSLQLPLLFCLMSLTYVTTCDKGARDQLIGGILCQAWFGRHQTFT